MWCTTPRRACRYEAIKHVLRDLAVRLLRGGGKDGAGPTYRDKLGAHAADSLVYMLQLTLGYFLMLIAMVYVRCGWCCKGGVRLRAGRCPAQQCNGSVQQCFLVDVFWLSRCGREHPTPRRRR